MYHYRSSWDSFYFYPSLPKKYLIGWVITGTYNALRIYLLIFILLNLYLNRKQNCQQFPILVILPIQSGSKDLQYLRVRPIFHHSQKLSQLALAISLMDDELKNPKREFILANFFLSKKLQPNTLELSSHNFSFSRQRELLVALIFQ